MLLSDLIDAAVPAEDRELLDYWGDFVAGLEGDRLASGATATIDEMLDKVGAIRDQGWLSIATDDEIRDAVYFGALTRLHHRSTPIPAPVLELWGALRLLRRLAPTSEAAAALLDAAEHGEAIPALSVPDLFDPQPGPTLRTGWAPFAPALTTLVAVRDGDGVRLLAAAPDPATADPTNSPDPTLPSWRIRLDIATQADLGPIDSDELDATRAGLLVAQAAAMTGQARALLEATVSYLGIREQFGVPIGSFQALRHRAADLAVELHAADQVARHAAEHLAGHVAPLALGHMAKAFCGAAALRIASEAIQLHGGIGFTWEGGLHFGLKRIMHFAMTGPTISDCQERLGRWAIDSPTLLWAGGLDEAEERREAGQG